MDLWNDDTRVGHDQPALLRASSRTLTRNDMENPERLKLPWTTAKSSTLLHFFGVMLCCSMFSEVARVLHDRFFGAALRKYTSTMEHIVSSEFNNYMSSYIYTQLYTHNYICMMYVYNLQIYNYVYKYIYIYILYIIYYIYILYCIYIYYIQTYSSSSPRTQLYQA